VNDATPNPQRALLLDALRDIERLEKALNQRPPALSEAIAIVGAGCRLPGDVADPESYWELLASGRDAVSEMTPERAQRDGFDAIERGGRRSHLLRGGLLADIAGFEPLFFGISPREAVDLDPQHRLLLEVAWEACEHAGIAPARLRGTNTGVFVGIGGQDYLTQRLSRGSAGVTQHLGIGCSHAAAPGRIAYTLGLTGPALAVDTACSSSLVALHLACASLRRNECDAAIVAGVNLMLAPEPSLAFDRAGMLSPNGRCKTFDRDANGYVRGEGAVALLLKRRSSAQRDGDLQLALIRGTAVNQDGASAGLTVPNGRAQSAVIRAALSDAGVAAADVDYVEAHGTATSLGDPIEAHALGAVYGDGRRPDRPLRIGSVKTNIGHLEAAAGLAGLLKVALALHERALPAQLHLAFRNPHVEWSRHPLRVQSAHEPWLTGEHPRCAAVSSFGFAGTNAHAVLEEAAAPEPRPAPAREGHVFCLSARTETALQRLAGLHAEALARAPARLVDVCYTSAVGRNALAHRAAMVVRSEQELIERLRAIGNGSQDPAIQRGAVLGDSKRIAFGFSGQATEHAGRGRELYDTEATFRSAIDRCCKSFEKHGEQDLRDVLWSDASRDTRDTQPALFALQVASFELLRSWRIEPDVVLGHSLGEYAAAYAARVFDLDAGIALVAARGRLMQACEVGAMAAVQASPEQLQPHIAGSAVVIAAYNGPAALTIAGPPAAIRRARESLSAAGHACRELPVHRAFHSPGMTEAAAQYERAFAGIVLSRPRVPVVSSMLGRVVRDELCQVSYWTAQLTQPVRWLDALQALEAQHVSTAVELGPDASLSALAARQGDGVSWWPGLRKGRRDAHQMQSVLAALFTMGRDVDWDAVYAGQGAARCRLPTYPFEREPHWFERSDQGASRALDAPRPAAAEATAGPERRRSVAELVAEVAGLPAPPSSDLRLTQDLGLDSMMLVELRARLCGAYPELGQTPLGILFGGVQISDLERFVQQGVARRRREAEVLAVLHDPGTLVDALEPWLAARSSKPFTRIENRWVHKAEARNVLVGDVERLAQGLLVSGLIDDREHPFFYEHPQDHVPGLYLIEAVRQFIIAGLHRHHEVPLNRPVVLSELGAEFLHFAEHGAPVVLVGAIVNTGYVADGLANAGAEVLAVQSRRVIGRFRGDGMMVRASEYERMRSEPRTLEAMP
jgi:acyl transferase domain-containing protein